jgi:uncharacterized protein with von Willebrand factor type A (vWA) domain
VDDCHQGFTVPGAWHTNTVAGASLAMDLLRRKRNTNKQILMITDGKPSCVREKTAATIWTVMVSTNILSISVTARHNKPKLHSITTFMIANDPYLQQFVNKFTGNQGRHHRTERTGWRSLKIMKRIVKRELNK